MLPALQSLLDPISPREFREGYYGKQPLLIEGRPEKFAELFTWDDLNRMLNASAFPHPHVEVSVPGKRNQPASAGSILEQCRAGATVIVNMIDTFDPKVGELARALEAETGEPMNVNLYLSQPDQAGVARHYDRHDVFVMQIYGHKAWSVFDPTLDKPILKMAEQAYEPQQPPSLECELAPGDVLYIPRGHWHEALAQRALSLHLTLGVNARTGIDFLTWLVDQLRGDVRFRDELPLSFTDEPPEIREERRREHVAKLGELVRARLEEPATLASFNRYCVASEHDSRRFKLPQQLFENPTSQLALTHFHRDARQRSVLEDLPEEQISLSAWGNIFHFPKNARPLVEFILSRTDFTLEEAMRHAGELTEEGVREILDPLVREGILDADVTRRTASAPSPATPGRR